LLGPTFTAVFLSLHCAGFVSQEVQQRTFVEPTLRCACPTCQDRVVAGLPPLCCSNPHTPACLLPCTCCCAVSATCAGTPSALLPNGSFPASCASMRVGGSCQGNCSSGFAGSPSVACVANASSPTGGSWAAVVNGSCVQGEHTMWMINVQVWAHTVWQRAVMNSCQDSLLIGCCTATYRSTAASASGHVAEQDTQASARRLPCHRKTQQAGF
jgi:hypothetical protein